MGINSTHGQKINQFSIALISVISYGFLDTDALNKGVALETMIKFNRLKSLTTDFDLIVAALEKSPSGLMEVSQTKFQNRK